MSKSIKYVPITDLLKEIVDNRGKTVPTASEGTPLIATNCIKHSSIYPTFEKVRYVDDETMKTWFRAHLQPNDILFVNKGTPGRVCLVPDPVNFCAAQDMIGFRCDEKLVNYKYLFTALRSDEIQKKIENFHVGLVIPHFRKQDLPSLMIPMRSPVEQEAIGNLYITLSEKIELNQRINTELEATAKTLYYYWFVQFNFPDKDGKPYKSNHGKMVWNEELKRDIPFGWEVKKLGDVVKIVRGASPRPIDDFLSAEGMPWVKISDATATDNRFITQTKQFIIEDGISKSRHLQPDTLILSNSASPAIPRITKIETCVHDGWLIIDDYTHGITKEFMFHFFEQERPRIINMGSGSIFKNLKTEYIKDLNILLPPVELLEMAAPELKTISENIYVKTKESQTLTELRDWLLPMLMNGQVKVG